MDEKYRIHFSPSLCLTHNCNLNCIYCYQKHDDQKMSLDIAKKSIDWIFSNSSLDANGVEIGFIGGEPLLEFNLIKEIVAYTCSEPRSAKYIFYATTNGTLLTEEMKEWLTMHKDCFVLGLSLDGTKETHDYNRCSSFDQIDIDFFIENWPDQGVKMTLSEFSLNHLAENIKFVHSLGFREISGVNLFEGGFDWSDDKYLKILIPQLKELVSFYVENDTLALNQMLNKRIELLQGEKRINKWCGIGNGTVFFDVDGEMYPCPLVTPMTFTRCELKEILDTDFNEETNFVDEYCINNCYIQPICPTCAGANYLNNKTFKERDKRKCRIQKLIALFVADLQAKRIEKNPKIYNNDKLYHIIEAIKGIRDLYLEEFNEFLIL